MSVLLKGFENILVPEMNMGQLKTVLRDQFLVDAKSLTKVSGHPFRIAEIEAAINAALAAEIARARVGVLQFAAFRMKQLNVWPLAILLIADLLLVYLAEAARMNDMTPPPPPPRTGQATRKCAGAPAAATMRC